MLLVARREYAETVRTRMFWVSAFLPVVFFVGMVLVGGGVAEKMPSAAAREPRTVWREVAVADFSGELFAELDAVVGRYDADSPPLSIIVRDVGARGQDPEDVEARLDHRVMGGGIAAYLVLPSDILSGTSSPVLHVPPGSEPGLHGTLHGLLAEALASVRLREQGIAEETVAQVRQAPPLLQAAIAPPAQPDAEDDWPAASAGRAGAAFFFLFLMFFTMMSTAAALLTALIEERSSRVVEVLLSAVSPFQLMAGKIIGLAAVGLTVAGVCTAAVLLAAASKGILGDLPFGAFAYFLPYYLLGFLMVASLYAAVGAACNTMKEAQGMMMPVTFLFMLPVMFWWLIVRYPDSWPVLALSLFPTTSPTIMLVRMGAGGHVPALQVVASLAVLALSAPLVMWAASRAFRTAILMYGKPPKLRELLRWMCHG
jgi:ABC-2 type transport system permease protein